MLRGVKKQKIIKRDIILTNFILFIFLLEWFLKHPSMRYGGFVLFALPIFIYTSKKIETYEVKKKKNIFFYNYFIFFKFYSV